MSATHLTKDNFKKKVLDSDKPVVVDFWAVWCGPCRMAGPVIDELEEEYKGKVVIGKVNIDEAQELAQKYGVMSVPTVIIFKKGKEVDRQVGFPGKEGYQKMLEEHL